MTANPNPVIPEQVRCSTCQGWGWNKSAGNSDITAPITEPRSIGALKRHILARLCCSECGGTGRRSEA